MKSEWKNEQNAQESLPGKMIKNEIRVGKSKEKMKKQNSNEKRKKLKPILQIAVNSRLYLVSELIDLQRNRFIDTV